MIVGAIWSPRLQVGLFVYVDYDAEVFSSAKGFSYEKPLLFTKDNLMPLVKFIQDNNLGCAAGVERIVNYCPDLFPDTIFIDYYLAHHEKHYEQEPFVLVYTEFVEAGTLDLEKGNGITPICFEVNQLIDPPGTIINSVGMKLVPIPPGTFLMGGREGEQGYNPEEERLHRVQITRPFFMGMFAVTQGEYATLMGGNPSVFQGKNRPVSHVRWQDAAEFCSRLSDLPAEKSAGRSYRLPTEAEWEYCCRAGTDTAYHWGDTLSLHQANYCEGCVIEPQPTVFVGFFPPNAFGLFEMHGNVWEWCQDWYSLDYYQKSPKTDPTGPATGTHHVLRGGSASVQAHECRSAIRGESVTDGPDPHSEMRFALIGDFGFRVACDVRRG